ncbi:YhhN-like protein [Umbelopsis sp. PMI_123]|nr:YhhN-like protein [Umbelopsis sp. PMI_123]
MLMFKPEWAFLLGLVAFLLSHICYSMAFVKLGVRWTSSLSLLGVAASGAMLSKLLPWLLPNVDADMKVPVLVYMVAIIVMVITSLGSAGNAQRPLPQVLGAIAFMLSDIFVAREKFVATRFENAWIGLPLYFYAQHAIAYSAWKR